MRDKPRRFKHTREHPPFVNLGVSQAVPLVPLTEENEDAMEADSFQRLLRKLGVRAPANEQVGVSRNCSGYWCQLLLQGLQGKHAACICFA